MTAFTTRAVLRRSARLAIAGALVLSAVQGASADDAGVRGFFASIFGGSSPAAEAPNEPSYPDVPAPMDMPVRREFRVHRSRPLTVRLQRPKVIVAQGPEKPVKVSIMDDRTLRPGDAVMTAQGIRIFAGSTSWPYLPSDFISLDDAKHLSQDTSKVLAQLDRAPRG